MIAMNKENQITIPAHIRKELGITAKTKLQIIKRENEIVIRPMNQELERAFRIADKVKPKHKMTPEEMDELNERLFR